MIQVLSYLIDGLTALAVQLDRMLVKAHVAKYNAVKADLEQRLIEAQHVLEVYEERQRSARINLTLATCDVHKADLELDRAKYRLSDFLEG